jgi:hypothetical protein
MYECNIVTAASGIRSLARAENRGIKHNLKTACIHYFPERQQHTFLDLQFYLTDQYRSNVPPTFEQERSSIHHRSLQAINPKLIHSQPRVLLSLTLAGNARLLHSHRKLDFIVHAIDVLDKQKNDGSLKYKDKWIVAQVVDLGLIASEDGAVVYEGLHKDKVEDAVVDLLGKLLEASDGVRRKLLGGLKYCV